MKKLQGKGNWNEVKGKLTQRYGQFTDNDLAFTDGKEDELLDRLQNKLGQTKDEIRKASPSCRGRLPAYFRRCNDEIP